MAEEAPPQVAPPTSEPDKAKGRKWFERAKAVADSRNYEYAIEAYTSGLKVWPEAIEEGHKPLRAVAVARKMAGGKPLGFLESRKHSTSGKDFRQNMINGEFLWAHDPANHQHMEAMIINAAKGGFVQAGAWMSTICADTLGQEKKVSAGRFSALCDALGTIGEVGQKAELFQFAIDAYTSMIRVAQFWKTQHPQSQEAGKAYNDAQSTLTIVKGRFGSGESFHASIKDKSAQEDLRDKDRIVQADTRVDSLLDKARKEYEADPTVLLKLNAYVELLTRREREEDENKAIAALSQGYQQLKNYSLKVKADDIRIKQLNRKARILAAQMQSNPTDEVKSQAKQHKRQQLEFEIATFEERVKEYPTDLEVRFKLAERYFKAKRYDDAIPYFQQAQADGRRRDACKLYVGRCFYEKRLHTQAISVLKQAIAAHELGLGDETGKLLHYWQARSLEAADQKQEAIDVYGQLIQLDYNFLDARHRLEELRGDSGVAEEKTED